MRETWKADGQDQLKKVECARLCCIFFISCSVKETSKDKVLYVFCVSYDADSR